MFRKLIITAVIAAGIAVLAPAPQSHAFAKGFAGCVNRMYDFFIDMGRRRHIDMGEGWSADAAWDICAVIYQ